MVPSRPAAVKAHRPTVDDVFGAECRRPVDLGAKAELGLSIGASDPRFAVVKTGGHFLRVVADRGHDAHAGDDYASHSVASTADQAVSETLSRSGRRRAEQADADILDLIDSSAIAFQPPVSDAKNQLTFEDTLHVHAIDDLFYCGEHLIGEFHFADAKGAAPSRQSEPTQKEPSQLPKGIQAEAPRHHRIILEMSAEEPKIWVDVELRAHASFAVGTSSFGDLADPVDHQHRRQRQLRVARSEQLAATAGDKILIIETGTPLTHARSRSPGRAGRGSL